MNTSGCIEKDGCEMRYLCIVVGIIASTSCFSLGDTIALVDAKSGPWSWQNGGINSAYSYDTTQRDMGAPTIVADSPGTPIESGRQIAISFVSGGVSLVLGGGTVSGAGGGAPINNTVDPLFA